MNLAILGFGVVGSGVAELCKNRSDLCVKKILDLRDFPGLDIPVVKDINSILDDPEIDIVVETMGGFKPAYDFSLAALKAGKHLVTANKQMVAGGYDSLLETVREKEVGFRCTAAAGGGIPWLYELARASKLDEIVSVSGIMNGTTNYILDRMTKENADFGEVLSDAKRLGYAEADPTADVDGWDIRRKLLLSANIAFGVSLSESAIPMRGIRCVSHDDIAAFTEAGLICKIIGSAEKTGSGISAFVLPALFPAASPVAAVDGCFNRFAFSAKRIGSRAFYGQGAGSLPTAANVVRDCLDIASGIRGFYGLQGDPSPAELGEISGSFYLRTGRPEAFAELKLKKFGPGYLTEEISLDRLLPLLGQDDFIAILRKNN